MISFTQKELNAGLQKNFQISENYCRVIDQFKSVNWDQFRSKTIKLGIVSKRFPTTKRPSVIIKNGTVSGDIIVTRLSEDVEDLSRVIISDCDVSGKLKISGIKSDIIDVVGDFSRVEFINIFAREVNFCGEVKELVVRNINDTKMDFQIRGVADKVLVKDSEFHSLEFLGFNAKTTRIRNIEAESLILPTLERRDIKKVGSVTLQPK